MQVMIPWYGSSGIARAVYDVWVSDTRDKNSAGIGIAVELSIALC